MFFFITGTAVIVVDEAARLLMFMIAVLFWRSFVIMSPVVFPP